MVLMAASAMVGTLPGRTQGLGLVTESAGRSEIGRVDYAELNLWATLIGASGAIGVGRFIDRFGSRVVLAAVAGALGAVVLMSRVTTFAELAVAVTLTRALGQSALVGREHRHGRTVVRPAHRHGDGDLQRRPEHRLHDRVPGGGLARPVARLALRVVRIGAAILRSWSRSRCCSDAAARNRWPHGRRCEPEPEPRTPNQNPAPGTQEP